MLNSASKSTAQRRRNLIINYIPSHLQEEQLFDLFGSIGPIRSLRIMRNADGTGKGFGFVEYNSYRDAAKAITDFNGLQVWDKTIKVRYAKLGSSREGCHLFVQGFPPTWTTETLTKQFSMFGELLECRVLATNDRQSRRCGFVRFDLPRDAQTAIREINGMIPEDGDFQIKVTHATKRGPHMNRRHQSRDQPRARNRGNLNPDASKFHYPPTAPQFDPTSQEHDAFQRPLSYGYPARDFNPMFYQYNRGYGQPPLSEYGNSSLSRRIPPSLNSSAVDSPTSALNHPMGTTSFPLSHSSNESSSSLLQRPFPTLSNLLQIRQSDQESRGAPCENVPQRDATNEDKEEHCINFASLPTFLDAVHLKHICDRYGKVVDIIMQKDNNGNNLGCAIVKFETAAQKEAALDGLNGCEMCHKRIICH